MSVSQRVFTDALRDMQRAMAVFEQPFYDTTHRSLLAAPGSSLLHGNSHGGHSFFRYPATDMIETPDSYELSAELPGYDKKDIKVELSDDHTLVLSGSVSKHHEEKSSNVAESSESEAENVTPQPEHGQQLTKKDESEGQVVQHTGTPRWWVKERVSGSFSRSFALPTRIKAENIKASYENGILKVVISKSVEKHSKQISID